jgi:hypothetical protein
VIPATWLQKGLAKFIDKVNAVLARHRFDDLSDTRD